MSNQNSAARLASPAPTFEALIADAARRIGRTARLGEKDSQTLWDVQRGRNLVVLHRLASISRTCTSLADAVALPTALKTFIVVNHPALNCDPTTALRQEVEADGEESRALFEYSTTRTRANRERLIEALTRQEMAAHCAVESLQHGGAVRSLELMKS